MKIIGTKESEISKYLLDCFSILHFIFGIISYFIIYSLLKIFFVNIFSELEYLFIVYLIIILGSIFWEMMENSFLINVKIFKERDYVINSQMDTLLVFLGSIIGCYIYNLSWIFYIILIVCLFIVFLFGKILTIENTKK